MVRRDRLSCFVPYQIEPLQGPCAALLSGGTPRSSAQNGKDERAAWLESLDSNCMRTCVRVEISKNKPLACDFHERRKLSQSRNDKAQFCFTVSYILSYSVRFSSAMPNFIFAQRGITLDKEHAESWQTTTTATGLRSTFWSFWRAHYMYVAVIF